MNFGYNVFTLFLFCSPLLCWAVMAVATFVALLRVRTISEVLQIAGACLGGFVSLVRLVIYLLHGTLGTLGVDAINLLLVAGACGMILFSVGYVVEKFCRSSKSVPGFPVSNVGFPSQQSNPFR